MMDHQAHTSNTVPKRPQTVPLSPARKFCNVFDKATACYNKIVGETCRITRALCFSIPSFSIMFSRMG